MPWRGRPRSTLPDDPQLQQVIDEITVVASINGPPVGAKAYYADYGDPAAPWEFAGTTPITDTRIPYGFLRWKLEKDGFEPLIASAEGHELQSSSRPKSDASFGCSRPAARRLDGRFPAAKLPVRIRRLQQLDDYWIDRYEVTNADFKRFGRAGLRHGEVVEGAVRQDGRALAWKDAMELFKDKTGRPGPATWSLGTFPEGEGDHAGGRRELVRSGRLRGVRGQGTAVTSPLGVGGGTSAQRTTSSGTSSARAT